MVELSPVGEVSRQEERRACRASRISGEDSWGNNVILT